MPYFNKSWLTIITRLLIGRRSGGKYKYGYPKDVMVWDVERGKSDALKHVTLADRYLGRNRELCG